MESLENPIKVEDKPTDKQLVYDRDEYAKKDFWNDRFKETNGFFDWYAKWQQIKPHFLKLFPRKEHQYSQFLMVGCGNSRLSEEMHQDGFKFITNMDISQIVLEKMSEIYHPTKCPEFDFIPMDATNMSFRDNAYDICFDKGTYDALACGPNKDILRKLVQEMIRVCSKAVVIISSGTPEKRLPLLQQFTENKNKIEYYELELSKLANLINVLRTELKDKPLSHALKDKDILKKALLTIVNHEEKKISEIKDPRKKLMALMMKAKAKRQSEQIEEAFPSKPVEVQIQEVPTEVKEVPSEVKTEETEVKEEQVPDVKNEEPAKKYDPKRQEFVMMYVIYK